MATREAHFVPHADLATTSATYLTDPAAAHCDQLRSLVKELPVLVGPIRELCAKLQLVFDVDNIEDDATHSDLRRICCEFHDAIRTWYWNIIGQVSDVQGYLGRLVSRGFDEDAVFHLVAVQKIRAFLKRLAERIETQIEELRLLADVFSSARRDFANPEQDPPALYKSLYLAMLECQVDVTVAAGIEGRAAAMEHGIKAWMKAEQKRKEDK